MKAFAVRQKSTGLFIPRLKRGNRRGGSHLEPSNERDPRLFNSKKSAQAFLGNWLQGIMKNSTYTTYEGEVEGRLEIIKQPHRNKSDMEIVEFNLVEVK